LCLGFPFGRLAHSIMAHLTEQLGRRLLAGSLPSAEILAAIEHVRTCTSCRDDLIALRSNKPGSLDDQILPVAPGEQHPTDDLLAAYADDDLEPAERASVAAHLRTCNYCQDLVLDLGNFRSELLELPAQNFEPNRQRNREHSQREPESLQFIRVAQRFFRPVILGTALAAALLIVAGLVSTQLFYRPPVQPQVTFDTIQDGALTFRVAANGQIMPSSTQLPEDAVAVLASSMVELARSRLLSVQAMRGLSETPAPTGAASSEATTLPAGEYFFSREIFGAIVALPRATPDPDVQPNGIVVRDAKPVLSWSPLPDDSPKQTVTVRDCSTGQIIVETDVPGSAHSFTIPVPLARGAFYSWQVTYQANGGDRSEIPASGRFKVISARDLQSLSSSAALSSHLLETVLLARAGLFAEAETELNKLAASNPNSPTIVAALSYVRELEGN
jgi:hypothetical protein